MGRVLHHFSKEETEAASWHVSKFGGIHKRHKENKWQTYCGQMGVEGIDAALCSLSYARVHEVANAGCLLGLGTELAEADIKVTYRITPILPDDRPLLAMKWEGHIYVNGTLPFGLQSAPKIVNAVSDAIE